jgi:hypothetical protein
MGENGRAIALDMLVEPDAGASLGGKRAGLELKPVHPSSQQVEDVVYDMGRDYDVMNRQREGVVGAGIIKR